MGVIYNSPVPLSVYLWSLKTDSFSRPALFPAQNEISSNMKKLMLA
jgi:hypothetical protein